MIKPEQIRKEVIETATRFINARVGARKELRGSSFAEALDRGPRWYPSLGGQGICLDEKTDGYITREEALEAARRFRAHCQQLARGEIQLLDGRTHDAMPKGAK